MSEEKWWLAHLRDKVDVQRANACKKKFTIIIVIKGQQSTLQIKSQQLYPVDTIKCFLQIHLVWQRLPLPHEVLELDKVEHPVFVFVKLLEARINLEEG